MRSIFLTFIFLSLMALPAIAKGMSEADIKQAIIEKSIESYSGSCPCPYSRDRAGRSCGRRSAYSKPGGASPLCYPDDVTPDLVERFKESET